MCTLQNAAMRLLGLWSANCVEDESFRYRFRLEDFLNEENIAAVAERDLFAEHDPERLRRDACHTTSSCDPGSASAECSAAERTVQCIHPHGRQHQFFVSEPQRPGDSD